MVNSGRKIFDQPNDVEKAAWKSLKNVTTNSLENQKAETTVILWLILYNPTQLWGYYMSLQVCFIDGHLHFSHKTSGQ